MAGSKVFFGPALGEGEVREEGEDSEDDLQECLLEGVGDGLEGPLIPGTTPQ